MDLQQLANFAFRFYCHFRWIFVQWYLVPDPVPVAVPDPDPGQNALVRMPMTTLPVNNTICYCCSPESLRPPPTVLPPPPVSVSTNLGRQNLKPSNLLALLNLLTDSPQSTVRSPWQLPGRRRGDRRTEGEVGTGSSLEESQRSPLLA